MNYNLRNQDSSADDIQVYNLQDQPEDQVSDLQWAPNNEFVFAVSCWDGKILIYQLQEPQHSLQKVMFFQHNEPVLKICWMDDASIIFAGFVDLKDGVLFSAGGDGTLTFWNHISKLKCREMEFNSPVVCCQINNKGNLMAYVIGYDWSQGVWGLEKAQRCKVFVHLMNNNDVVSKEQIGNNAYNSTFAMR